MKPSEQYAINGRTFFVMFFTKRKKGLFKWKSGMDFIDRLFIQLELKLPLRYTCIKNARFFTFLKCQQTTNLYASDFFLPDMQCRA